MTDFKAIKFKPEHIDLMSLRPEEIQGGTYEEVRARIVELASQSAQVLTYTYEGRIIAVMGFMILWRGVLQGWVVPTIYVHTAPFSFAKTVKRFIEVLAKTFSCHRFQTGSYADEFHIRWMKFLGFEKEGVSKQFTPDKKDYINYARLF